MSAAQEDLERFDAAMATLAASANAGRVIHAFSLLHFYMEDNMEDFGFAAGDDLSLDDTLNVIIPANFNNADSMLALYACFLLFPRLIVPMKTKAQPQADAVHAEMMQMVAERDAALLTLDMAQIIAYAQKYGARFADDHETFWISVHMARTAARTLPMEARKLSKRWLLARGLRSFDDGDVQL